MLPGQSVKTLYFSVFKPGVFTGMIMLIIILLELN